MIENCLTTVAFTGHRTYSGEADSALLLTVGELYARGFRTFLCGMAVGFDLAAAEAVLACRDAEGEPTKNEISAPAWKFVMPDVAEVQFDKTPVPDNSSPDFQPAAFLSASWESGPACAPYLDMMQTVPAYNPPASPKSMPISADSDFPDVAPAYNPLPGLQLVAVVPFEGQETRFSAADRERYCRVLAAADQVVVLSPAYHPGCYAVRNNYLTDHAAVLVAWYDGSPGGTHYTVRRALARRVELINLSPTSSQLPVPDPTLF